MFQFSSVLTLVSMILAIQAPPAFAGGGFSKMKKKMKRQLRALVNDPSHSHGHRRQQGQWSQGPSYAQQGIPYQNHSSYGQGNGSGYGASSMLPPPPPLPTQSGPSSFSPVFSNASAYPAYSAPSYSDLPPPPPYTTQNLYPDLTCYEVPQEIRMRNANDFIRYSGNYEAALGDLQMVLIVDRSGSQQSPDQYPYGGMAPRGMFEFGWTQWDNTFMVAKYLAESIFQYDRDGRVPVIFFGNQASDFVVSSIGEMLMRFQQNKPTNEGTNLYGALELAFEKYLPKGLNQNTLFIILTDGRPNIGQESHIKKLIQKKITHRDPSGDHLNLLFIRIGDDYGAIQFLRDLDNSREIHQNVDTKSDNRIYQMGPKNVMLNSIFEHLDWQYQD